jgi:D-alanine-D-alanine ligase
MATGKAGKRHKVRLGILFGGKSSEYEVSLSSAASVIGALDPAEYEITAIGITRSGKLARMNEVRNMLPVALHDRIALWGGAGEGNSTSPAAWFFTGSADSGRYPEIIFPLLHGPYGEDGTIQGLLEIAGMPYIGCGVLASAMGMDKDVMKRLFAQASLPIVPFRVECSRGLKGRLKRLRHEVEAQFAYPIFSKPANLGSSVGVFKIHHAGEFDEAILSSAQFDRKIIIEQGIDARELECAVLGNENPEASVVGEVVPACEFYDYEAKYVNPGSRVLVPADIDGETEREVRHIALRAFETIDASGLARVDFFLDRKSGTVWLNEINTMPGFTSISMYPKLWAACGVPFGELIHRLVELGFERFRKRAEHAILGSKTLAGCEMPERPEQM